jgi:hypothetical protein
MTVAWRALICATIALLFPLSEAARSQESPSEASEERARANFARPIELADDDVRAFAPIRCARHS